jgi:septal ring factor EnvC (AmiA/AmiB activator)
MEEVLTAIAELKSEVVGMRTELLLTSFTIEKMEQQIQDLHMQLQQSQNSKTQRIELL